MNDTPDDSSSEPLPVNDNRRIPFAYRYPIMLGAVVGLGIRVLFMGHASSRWSAMVGAFVYGCPVVTGMVTVYLAERIQRRSWGYYISASFYATALVVIGSLLTSLEGLVCAIIVVPLFALMGMLGGLMMGLVCRLTNWPRNTMYCAGVLPLLIASLTPNLPMSNAVQSIHDEIIINATPAAIWSQLNNITAIRADEVGHALPYRIGVPLPVSGITEQTPQGRIRHSVWGKGVHFDEPITTWHPEHEVAWTYKFSADSFPPSALDDHVMIGGRYFDLIDTRYVITQLDNGRTKLSIDVHYRVDTDFNFYANRVAKLFLNGFSETVLNLYKQRAEKGVGQTLATR